MKHTKYLLALALIVSTVANSTVFALTVTEAVNSMQWPVASEVPSVANPRGNIGYILSNIFYGSTDGSLNGKIKSQYLDLSGISGGSSVWTASGGVASYTGSATIANGLTVTSGNVNLPSGSIDSNEIANGSLLFADWNQNGCTNNQIPKWSTGSGAWVCGDVGLTAETDPLWMTQSGAYVKKTDYASSVANGVLTSADWNTFNSKLSASGATVNMLPKFSPGGVLMNSLVYDDGTKVGIGTNSPTQRLDVNGNIIVQGTGSLFFRDTNNGISSPSLNQLAFNTNGVGRIMIDTTGYVGIGTTAPSEMLEVNGNIKLSGASASYRVTNVAAPIGDYDAANKVYVDTKVSAAGGSGVASQYLSDGSYYSEGGSPYFCRLNVLSGTSQKIVAVNQNKLCNSTSNLYCNAGLCNADASILNNIKDKYQLIAAAGNQSCSITDWQVYCWGYNGYGQKYIDFSSSQQMAWVWAFSCAVATNGQVKCWGDNTYGQLGNGTNTTSSSPVTVLGINNAIKVVTAGADSTGTAYGRACAILDSGAIKCWGQLPQYGQTNTPLLITWVTNAIDISLSNDNAGAGGYYCAVLATGSVVCSGDNNFGQLGNSTQTSSSWLTPVTVSGVTNATRVFTTNSYSTGRGMSCAILADGTVKCWGSRGSTNRMGDAGGTGNALTATAQAGIRTSTGMSLSPVGYSSGLGHGCEVETDGTVKCWGRNSSYQLGDGTALDRHAPVTVLGVTNAVKVFTAQTGHTSYDYGRSCALLADGTVKCWGYWFGAGTVTTIVTWVLDFSMTQINTGAYSYWCAVLTNNTIKCGGTGAGYQLGNGATTNYVFNSNVAVTGIANAVKVYTTISGTSGNGRTCALLSDATVKCWGFINGAWVATPTIIGSMTWVVDFSMSQENTQWWSADGHWCAVLDTGAVRCAGNGSVGQLGNGGSTNIGWWPHVAVSSVTNATRVYTNEIMHATTTRGTSCASLADGTMKCWGYMNGDQSLTPVTLSNITDVVDFSLSQTANDGTSFYCAALSNGTVFCGGNGSFGQLGNGTTSAVTWSTPVQVTGINNAIKVYTSNSFYASTYNPISCALLSDGQIKCWGADANYGRMGDGTVNATRTTPTNVASQLVNTIDLAITTTNGSSYSSHACGVQSDGTVKCWGMGTSGELGNGWTLSSSAPVTVVGITNAVRVFVARSAYSTDAGMSCALLADGTAKCWGKIAGSGWSTFATPVTIAGVSNAVDFSLSGYNGTQGHFCAVLATGSIVCAGSGTNGQLGNGTSTDAAYTSPVNVAGITNAIKVFATSSGYGASNASTCALLADGLIKCWGYNWVGQLGNGTITTTPTPSSVVSANNMYYAWIGTTTVDKSIPAAKDGITSATNIAAGAYHGCAIEGGAAKCWGFNAEGQLGNNSTTASSAPVGVFGITTATQIATGYMHSCAILADSTVKCWGLNTQGQLGNGTTTSSITPVTVSGISNAVQITAGDYHTCAVLADGSAKCWGLNTRGQLGQGNVGANLSSTPLTVVGVTGAARIAAGDAYTCASTASGTAYCWGENKWGQIGNGTYTAFVATPYLVPGITTANRIGAGGNHACAVNADGTMKCWGLNGSAQQGTTGYFATANATSILGLTNILAMVGGTSHSCTISTDLGTSSCYGWNRNGQIGNGTTLSTATPASLNYPSSSTNDTTVYQVSLCETRDAYTGNLGGIDGANSICVAQCGKGYKMARESELANFKNSASSANIYWIDRALANNCSDWTDSSAWNTGATMQFNLSIAGNFYLNYVAAPATAGCHTAKQLLCERGVR